MQDGARGIQIQQKERFNDRFSVQILCANRHTYVATRLLRNGTRYREARRAGLLPDNNTNRRKSERTGQDAQLLIILITTTHTPILKYRYTTRYTHVNPHLVHHTRESTLPLKTITWYLVFARLCCTPHLAVHRGIHTRRACVRTSQCHFFIVSHRFFSSVVLTPADFCCSVTSTSGISCNLAVQFDIPPRQKTLFSLF